MPKLDWMPVGRTYDEADGALMPGLATKHGVIARIGDGQVFVEVWPSEPPEYIDDAVTLTLTVDDEVVEEVGRYPSFEEAAEAAQIYIDEHQRGAP